MQCTFNAVPLGKFLQRAFPLAHPRIGRQDNNAVPAQIRLERVMLEIRLADGLDAALPADPVALARLAADGLLAPSGYRMVLSRSGGPLMPSALATFGRTPKGAMMSDHIGLDVGFGLAAVLGGRS